MTATDTTPLQERIAEAVRQALSDGEALQCTRVWEAWLYKTMTDEDFTDASDGPLVEEVAAAVLPIMQERERAAVRAALDGLAEHFMTIARAEDRDGYREDAGAWRDSAAVTYRYRDAHGTGTP